MFFFFTRYNEDTFNCYTFIIEFLKELKPPSVTPDQLTKVAFCSSFVVPKAIAAAKYISVYRQVQEAGSVALEMPYGRKDVFRRNLGHGITSRDNSGSDDESVKDVVKKLDDLVFSSSNVKSDPLGQDLKKVPKRFVPSNFHPTVCRLNSDGSSLSSDSEIETRVSEVINDLLKQRLEQKSQKYLTPYADDIKRDLRSFVPGKSIPSKSSRHFYSSDSSLSSFECEMDGNCNLPLKGCLSELSLDRKSLEKDHSIPKCTLVKSNPHKITIDVKPTKQFNFTTNIDIDEPPMGESSKTKTLSHENTSNIRHSAFNSGSLKNPVKKLRPCISPRKFKYRSLRSLNHCPEYDWFGGNTLRKKKKKVGPSIWVRDMTKPSVVDEKAEKMTYSEWVNRKQSRSSDSDLSSGSYQDIISVQSTNDTISFDGEFRDSNIIEKTHQTDCKLQIPINGGMSPYKPVSNKPHYLTQPIPSRIGNGYLIPPQNFKNIIPVNPPVIPLPPPIKKCPPKPLINLNMECMNSPITSNPLFIEEPPRKEPTQVMANAKSHTGYRKKVQTNPRTKLRRAPTWRYGQEPCPENYEGKLMGKIDLSKKHDWDSKGVPSSLSMPGYIYDEGVLTETRC